jgi:Activator of Hsp90 ATPase homolog 1-like protein
MRRVLEVAHPVGLAQQFDSARRVLLLRRGASSPAVHLWFSICQSGGARCITFRRVEEIFRAGGVKYSEAISRRRVAPPYVLSFTWTWESPRADVHETQVTLEFHPNGDATDLVFTHERFRDEEQRKGHTEGWTGCLNRLAGQREQRLGHEVAADAREGSRIK